MMLVAAPVSVDRATSRTGVYECDVKYSVTAGLPHTARHVTGCI
jgi:hypothetical protein